MLLDGWRRAYAAGAAWRSIGHLTTYGPTDNPTFVTTFSPFPNRQIETNESRTRTTYIAIAVPPGVIPTLISDITDQEPGVITKRDDTRSLLPRPVDHVAFAKENPSYQGPGNSKNRLLPRLRSVRVHHANYNPVRSLSILQRETTRDRSYQGPSITSRLLRRTLPTKALGTQRTDSYQGFVRFASTTQINTQYDLFIECQYPQQQLPQQLQPSSTTTYTTIYASHYVQHRNPISELGQWDYLNQ